MVRPPALRILSRPERAVASHPGQQAGGGGRAVFRCDRFEQHIDRRPARMPLGVARQAQAAFAHDEMLVARRDDDAAGGSGDRHSIRGIGHAAAGLPVEPIGKRGPERLVDMKDEEDRELKIRGQGAQDFHAPRPGRRSMRRWRRARFCAQSCSAGARALPARGAESPASRARGWVMTRMRATSFTMAMKRDSHAPAGCSRRPAFPAHRPPRRQAPHRS